MTRLDALMWARAKALGAYVDGEPWKEAYDILNQMIKELQNPPAPNPTVKLCEREWRLVLTGLGIIGRMLFKCEKPIGVNPEEWTDKDVWILHHKIAAPFLVKKFNYD